MPADRQLAFGSVSDDPAMRDFRMTSHLARYSGVSFGAVAGRPARPSLTATGRGGVPAPRAAADGAVRAHGPYQPVNPGFEGDPRPRLRPVHPSRRDATPTQSKAKVFDIGGLRP